MPVSDRTYTLSNGERIFLEATHMEVLEQPWFQLISRQDCFNVLTGGEAPREVRLHGR